MAVVNSAQLQQSYHNANQLEKSECLYSVLNVQRGELTICSVEASEWQSNGNFNTTLSKHRR